MKGLASDLNELMDKLTLKLCGANYWKLMMRYGSLSSNFVLISASGVFVINSGMKSYLEEFDYLFEGIGEQISALSLVERLDRIGERLQMILNLDERMVESLGIQSNKIMFKHR